jgi:hypothetical protein
MLQPVFALRAFLNLRTVYFLIFNFFGGGHDKPRITVTTDTESADTEAHLYGRLRVIQRLVKSKQIAFWFAMWL